MKILCLDQSTKITGWSLWTNKNLATYGLLNSNVKENNPIARMREMNDLISSLLATVKPDYVVLEQVQFQNNYKIYSQLSQMQGVVFSILFERDLGFCLIEPSAWKSFCNIKGKKRIEQKANTIQMVQDKFNWVVSEDEADSIGIGIWASENVKMKDED